jgi:hypothetical protein
LRKSAHQIGEVGNISDSCPKTPRHVDTTVICRIYGGDIPNLTRRDGSAFEKKYEGAQKKIEAVH